MHGPVRKKSESVAARLSSAIRPTTEDVLVGSTLGGRLLVTSRIGRGSFGAVYVARHLHLAKLVAVKVLHASLQEEDSIRARFHAEGRAASLLDHANLVRVLDFGEEQDGSLWLAMELLEGTDLGTILAREGRLTVDRAVEVMMQVSAGLAHAHSHGIVHGDVKPGNLILTMRADDEGETREHVKLCDFGVARSSADGAGSTVLGTPAYMSPEQCIDDSLDQRSDVYACGILFYELVTGAPPFDSEDIQYLLRQHIVETPTPPSQRVQLGHVAMVIDAFTSKALAKDPGSRFANMKEMRAGLREISATLGRPLMPSLMPSASPGTWAWSGAEAAPAVAAVSEATIDALLAAPRLPSDDATLMSMPPVSSGPTTERMPRHVSTSDAVTTELRAVLPAPPVPDAPPPEPVRSPSPFLALAPAPDAVAIPLPEPTPAPSATTALSAPLSSRIASPPSSDRTTIDHRLDTPAEAPLSLPTFPPSSGRRSSSAPSSMAAFLEAREGVDVERVSFAEMLARGDVDEIATRTMRLSSNEGSSALRALALLDDSSRLSGVAESLLSRDILSTPYIERLLFRAGTAAARALWAARIRRPATPERRMRFIAWMRALGRSSHAVIRSSLAQLEVRTKTQSQVECAEDLLLALPRMLDDGLREAVTPFLASWSPRIRDLASGALAGRTPSVW